MTTTTTPTATTTLTTEQADALHNGILTAFSDVLKARRAVVKAIKDAKAANLHTARGFDSWPAYLADALTNVKVSKDDAKFVAVALVHFGMSQRDAAAVVDLSQPTVQRAVKADAEQVAEEVATITGDAADAKPADTTTDAKGREQSRGAKRGKGREAKAEPKADAPKASKPVEQPKRTAWAQAQDAMGVLIAAWPNLTTDQQEEIADALGSLTLGAE